MKTQQRGWTNCEIRHISFGTTDQKGRNIGAAIRTHEVDFYEVPEAEAYYDTAPGHYFAFEPRATRNQQDYGACQYSRYFLSSKEREAAIETYLKQARKRAGKIAQLLN